MSGFRGRGTNEGGGFHDRGGFRGRGADDPQRGGGFRGRGGPDAPGGAGGFRGRGADNNFRGGGGGGGFRGRGGEDFRGGFRGRGAAGGPGFAAHSHHDPAGGRGGRGGGMGGRGGGPGEGAAARSSRERDGMQYATNLSNFSKLQNVEVETNLFPLDISGARYHAYKVSYEVLENPIEGETTFQLEAQQFLLRGIIKSVRLAAGPDMEEQLRNLSCALLTGASVLVPRPLPIEDRYTTEYTFSELDKETRERVSHKYRLTLIADEGEKRPTLPANSLELNMILSAGIQAGEYSSKVGSVLVNPNTAKEEDGGIVSLDGVYPRVMRIRTGAPSASASGGAAPTDDGTAVVQLDVVVKVASRYTCLEIMQELRNRPNSDRMIAEMLLGQRATATVGSRDVVRISSVSDKRAGDAAGLKRDPTLTFAQYYQERYNITLRPDGAMLQCRTLQGSSRRLCYPAEVLRPLVLREDQKRHVVRLCSIYPHERLQRVSAALARIAADARVTDYLAAYGISIASTERLRVRGSVLRPPTVYVPRGGTPGDLAALNPNEPAYVGQQGFASGLIKLRLPPPPAGAPSFAPLLMDSELLHSNVPQSLRTFNVALPAPQRADLDLLREGSEGASSVTPGSFVCVRLPSRDMRTYNSLKSVLCQRGALSQMAQTRLDRTVPQMIAQQMAAKAGQLCFLTDVGDCGACFKSAGGPTLLIGVEVGRAETLEAAHGGRRVKRKTYTVTLVAFLAEGKQWRTFCNHQRVLGSERTVGDSSSTAAAEDSGKAATDPQYSNAGNIRENATEVLNKFVGDFLKEVRQHFGLTARKAGSVVLYRNSTSEGEVDAAAALADHVTSVFAGWNYAVVTAQVRSRTRFALPPPPGSPVKELVNVPRGFHTSAAIDVLLTDSGASSSSAAAAAGPRSAFFLVGAFCTLGHASNTLYIVLASKGIDDAALRQLTFALCFIFPNRADGMPVPLPMKCAADYARKFVSLPEVSTLHPALKPTMHYL